MLDCVIHKDVFILDDHTDAMLSPSRRCIWLEKLVGEKFIEFHFCTVNLAKGLSHVQSG